MYHHHADATVLSRDAKGHINSAAVRCSSSPGIHRCSRLSSTSCQTRGSVLGDASVAVYPERGLDAPEGGVCVCVCVSALEKH